MHTCPANERRIADVERGRICEAVVPLSPGETLAVGDTVLFAHSRSKPGQRPDLVAGGDSVLVALTDVVDLGATDPDTGHPLWQLRWSPLGMTTAAVPARSEKKSRPRQSV